MLALGPGSGYDLKKRIEGSVAPLLERELRTDLSDTSARLASRRLVERRLERQKGKPDRYIYSITAEGARAPRGVARGAGPGAALPERAPAQALLRAAVVPSQRHPPRRALR